MKYYLILFFLAFTISGFAQASKFMGIYLLSTEAEDGIFQYKMVLKEDGTFLFRMNFSPTNPEGKTLEITHNYGGGKWRVNGKQVFFVVNKATDIDINRTLDFSKTRARIQKPAEENLKGESGPVQLIFFDSNISWIKGLKLNKQ